MDFLVGLLVWCAMHRFKRLKLAVAKRERIGAQRHLCKAHSALCEYVYLRATCSNMCKLVTTRHTIIEYLHIFFSRENKDEDEEKDDDKIERAK